MRPVLMPHQCFRQPKGFRPQIRNGMVISDMARIMYTQQYQRGGCLHHPRLPVTVQLRPISIHITNSRCYLTNIPERPGQPECSYFIKTGDFYYKSGCKFHHSKNRILKTAPCALNDIFLLKIRPDQNICSNYTRYGICKFGPSCKFNHPKNYGDSASSPVSAPVEPSSFRQRNSNSRWLGMKMEARF
ncbi:zinc finger CCCH domain-containing protein 43-like isoform X1 [Actinidia eriantha]|uniref:zinc finger CCCH domain-containing protein 43-like isoform X1 n=1 Tax=Actinidia eriantha TaxID=165200 RepID=UPI0025874613|nr:zinc finger CCCH domain-containing protein 43-like isoform X1 [Actinidia eriantha]